MIQQSEIDLNKLLLSLQTGTIAPPLGSHRPAVSVCWIGPTLVHVRPCGPALTERDRGFSLANWLLIELEGLCC